MKVFVLILKEYDQFPTVIGSTKTNPFKMVLDYFVKNNITKILKSEEFDPLKLADGKYLVSVKDSKTDFIEWEVKNIGYIFDSIATTKINRLCIREVNLLDKENDDVMSSVMSELTARYQKFKI